jgi:hypothetical protein
LRADATPTAAASESPTAVVTAASALSGFEVGVRLGALSVFNAAPLAYTPLELGYQFKNGLRARTGIQLFYYRGDDTDPKDPSAAIQHYSYEMLDWRLSADYVVPLPLALRPMVGLSLDVVSGSRKLDRDALGNPVVNPPAIAAWSALAPGGLLGVEWKAGEAWSLELAGRYAYGFSATGSIASGELGWHYLF